MLLGVDIAPGLYTAAAVRPGVDAVEDNHGALLRYRKFNAMKYLTNFAGQNWLLIMSGVVLANQRGDSSGSRNHQTVSFIPDMAGPDDPTATSGPLNWAITRYGIPRPPGTVGQQYLLRFSVEEWSPFVSLGSVFDQGPAVNAGFAVDDWRPITSKAEPMFSQMKR
jgi:hypothetical protein